MEYEKYTWTFAKNYVGTSRGRIYNKRTQRFAIKTACGGSVGYWMDRVFRTAKELNETKQPTPAKVFLASAKAEGLPF